MSDGLPQHKTAYQKLPEIVFEDERFCGSGTRTTRMSLMTSPLIPAHDGRRFSQPLFP